MVGIFKFFGGQQNLMMIDRISHFMKIFLMVPGISQFLPGFYDTLLMVHGISGCSTEMPMFKRTSRWSIGQQNIRVVIGFFLGL